MELGRIGLGRMGANMTPRLVRGGHRVVGFDFKLEARKRVEQHGAESVASLDALAGKLAAPRTVPDSGEGRWTVAEAIDLRARAGDHARAACAPGGARFGFIRSEDAVGDAQSVWRARDQEA